VGKAILWHDERLLTGIGEPSNLRGCKNRGDDGLTQQDERFHG
jgi:hypothetical protein